MPPPALPIPFYNACYFPFFTKQGWKLYQELKRADFTPTHDCPIADILRIVHPKRIFKIHPLQMEDAHFQAAIILDEEGKFVTAYCITEKINELSDADLLLERSILHSLPDRNYHLGCFYHYDLPRKNHLFRFVYADRQKSFISAQVFDFSKDPVICAVNFALMTGYHGSPASDFLPLQMPDPIVSEGPPRKRPHSNAFDFGQLFSTIWPTIDSSLRLVSSFRDGDTVWYQHGRSKVYLRLSWEVVMGPQRVEASTKAKDKGRKLVAAHVIWDGTRVVEEHGEIIAGQEMASKVRSSLGIPSDDIQYLRTYRRYSLVEIPLAELSLHHQLSLLHLVLTTDNGMRQMCVESAIG